MEGLPKVERATLTAQEAATYIGINYCTLTKMCKAGKFPHFRLGRRILFSREELDDWMKKEIAKSVQQPEGYGKLRKVKG